MNLMLVAGLACLWMAATGCLVTWLTLPDIPRVPVPVFVVLLLLAAVSATAAGRRLQALPGISAVVLALAWAFIGSLVDPLTVLAARLASNPYLEVGATTLVRTCAGLILLSAALTVLVVWRALVNIAAVNPKPEAMLRTPAGLLTRPVMWKRVRRNGLRQELPPVVIGRDQATGRPVRLKGGDRFLHMLVVGPTGCGKTTTILAPMVFSDLERISHGEKLGVTVVEPKGDFTERVAAYCRHLRIPYLYVNPVRPGTATFNPLEGRDSTVAETICSVLAVTFGVQEPFFAQVQETAGRQVILLLKALKGDELTLLDVVRALRDPEVLSRHVVELEATNGVNDLTEYFRRELLGCLRDRYFLFVAGMRQQLEDITGNELLRRVLIAKSDVNLDRHLAEGGVLLVNTAMGELARLGDTFGQLIILFLQSAVFRRPGTEQTRLPHYLYIDELPRYLNPELERLLSLGRSYRCACTLTIQSLSQLAATRDGYFASTVLTNCRNQVVFGGLWEEEALQFEREFGQAERIIRQATFANRVLLPHLFADSYRDTLNDHPRFPYTAIKELPAGRFIYRLVRDGAYLPPSVGYGKLPPVWDQVLAGQPPCRHDLADKPSTGCFWNL